ncbi:metallophosphoesterase [Burkholderia anthina]|uniref:metallophosphoesterase n=1 Tax=Burkholderia anthina TaxID=179879 RepID=UPI001FC8AE4D|nr:metallophosphoesterase [Burkholderia anthina]
MAGLVKTFAPNTAGRDFVVGDIHGHFVRLDACLQQVAFDPAVDRLFSVGDLVDRGPDSERVLEYVRAPWFHAVRGNHEDMAMRWPNGNMPRDNYVANGGGWMVASPPAFQREVADELSALPIAIEVGTLDGLVGIVHADCPFPSWRDFTVCLDMPLPGISNAHRKTLIACAIWSRDRFDTCDDTPVAGVVAVIVGHTPVKEVCRLGNTFYVDTGACFPNLDRLTLLQLGPRPGVVLEEVARA